MKVKIKVNPTIASLAKKIGCKFPRAEVFLVGGSVRDLLLLKNAKDYDLLVRGVPGKNLEKYLKTIGKVNLVGKSFGVFKFRGKRQEARGKNEVDIALPRTEHALLHTGGYKDFKVQSDYRLPVETDLSRRDFTINALAYNLENKTIIDPYGGLKDLDKKIIRAVGRPQERFSEDYSRLLRAIRFSCQLDFKIEEKTWQNIKKLVKNINKKHAGEFVVPRETIGKEILKSFYHNPVKALELLDASGLLKLLMPEILKMKGCIQPKNFHAEGDVFKHTVLCLKNLSSKKFQTKFPARPSINLILAALLHDIGKPQTIQTPKKNGTNRIRFNEHDSVSAKITQDICERLKLSSYKDEDIDCNCDTLFWLVRNHMLGVNKDNISKMKNTTIEKYFFSDRPGEEFLKLMFIDVSSTVPKSGKPDLGNFNLILKRIKKLSGSPSLLKKSLPKAILDGNEIMKSLKIKAGPQIGRIIGLLREEQLRGKIKTKKQATGFIKKLA